MASSNVCCVAGCSDAPIQKPAEFNKSYGINLALCQRHFDEFFEKFSKKTGVLGGNAYSGVGGNLNLMGILANALSHFTTEDKSEKLACILSIKFGKDVGGAIKALIGKASRSQEDLAPGSTSVAIDAAMKTAWWQEFFKAAGIYQPDNKMWLVQYVANNSKNIRESLNEAVGVDEDEDVDEREPKRSWTDWAKEKTKGARDLFDTGPSGRFGRKKNELVAKLAVAGAVDIYDRIINSILNTVGLQEKDIPVMYSLYSQYILPTFSAKGKITASDLNNLSNGDPKLYKDLIQAYKGIQKLSASLKAAPV